MNKKTLSFEVFPPRNETPISSVLTAIDGIASLEPDFISVTYGAGGSTKQNTALISSYIQNEKNISALAHLTCNDSSKEEIDNILKKFEQSGITKVLALRGDKPKDTTCNKTEFKYAIDLIKYLKNETNMTIAAACYPEGHPESISKNQDARYLLEKVEAGVDFLITQLFFDNAYFYDFLEKMEILQLKVPIICGIMPVTNASQIARISTLCCATIPSRLQKIIYRYQDDADSLLKAGIDYAAAQCQDLWQHDIGGLHIYSMNKPEVAKGVLERLNGVF